MRDFTDDSHRSTDDYPFGGGVGMIMKIEPIDRALQSLAVGEKGARPAGTQWSLFWGVLAAAVGVVLVYFLAAYHGQKAGRAVPAPHDFKRTIPSP